MNDRTTGIGAETDTHWYWQVSADTRYPLPVSV